MGSGFLHLSATVVAKKKATAAPVAITTTSEPARCPRWKQATNNAATTSDWKELIT